MNRSPVRLTGRLPDWSGRKGCERRQARSGNHRPSCKMEPPSRREGPAPALAEGGSSSFICGAFSGNNTAVPAARCRCIAETSIWPAAPIFCGCLRCSSVSVIAFGSTHATTAEHSRVCTVLRLDRSSGCSGSQRQISDGVSTLSCGRLPGKRKGISLALQNAGKDFGTSPAPESQRKSKTNAYTAFVVSEVGIPCTTSNGPSARICPVAFGSMTEPV
jgi:hypothetical protein